MFTSMEQNPHTTPDQARLHSGLRHDLLSRGPFANRITSPSTANKKSYSSISDKRNETKKTTHQGTERDFLHTGIYKAKINQVRQHQQRKQLEQQMLKSLSKPTPRLELYGNTEKTRRLLVTKTASNVTDESPPTPRNSTKNDCENNSKQQKAEKYSKESKTTKDEDHSTPVRTIPHMNEEGLKDQLMGEATLERHLNDLELGEMAERVQQLENCIIDQSEKETYFAIQQKVEEAVKNKKIFLIRGEIPYLERTLKKRGWIKKYESKRTRQAPYDSVTSLDSISLGNIHLPDGSLNEEYVIFNALRHVPPDFIWDCRNDFIEWSGHIKPDTMLNRFEKSFIYTSKLGMATILEDIHWYNEDGVASVRYPRSYNVARDRAAFLEDYRKTAAVSLLKWYVDQTDRGVNLSNKGSSPISLKQLEFAIKRCEEYVASKNDEYLDSQQIAVSSIEWDKFVDDYVSAVHHGNGIIDSHDLFSLDSDNSSLSLIYAKAVEILKKVKEVDPEYEMNGMRNIWILKPSNYCCGVGIAMAHKLSYIIKRVHDCARDYFIVQKYIEKPLLVKETKFDIRQWYLVTCSYPMTIWIYNSRPFSYESYHEAIHICNTAVQNKYVVTKNSVRSQDWDCERLNEYLKVMGYGDNPWYDEIYPKMRQAIVAVMLAAQEHMDKRKCSFELYGADFMVMDDLSVWLIEINTNPRMHPPGTRITQRLYPDVLDSLVKVVMDYPNNPNADTGNFVLEYKQAITDVQPQQTGTCMIAVGKSILHKPKCTSFYTNLQGK